MKYFKRALVFLNKIVFDQNDHQRETQYTKSIELDNGECMNVKGYLNLNKNKIKSNIYTLQNFYYKLLFCFFRRFMNFYLLILNIVSFSMLTIEQLQISYMFSLFLSFSLHTIKELYFDRLRRINDESVNSREVTIFQSLRKQLQIPAQNNLLVVSEKKTKTNINLQEYENQLNKQQNRVIDLQVSPMRRQSIETHQIHSMKREQKEQKLNLFAQKRWDELDVGDIIYLKYNEICPADILLLEMSTPTCSVGCGIFNGNTNEVRKKACTLTTISKEHKQTINQLDYRVMLSGIIKYDQSDVDYYYRGIVKLKKDPQAVEITKENVIFREQQLQNTYYVYGLVLGIGIDCRCYQGYKTLERKEFSGFFESKVNNYFLIGVFIIIVISIIQYLVQKYNYYNQNQIPSIHYLQILTFYSNLLPTYFYFVLDLVSFSQIVYKNYKFLHQRDDTIQTHPMFEYPSNLQDKSLLQMNTSNIADLAMVNHALIDKTGTITEQNFKIKQVFIFDTLFKIHHKGFHNKDFQDEIQKGKLLIQLNQPIMEENTPSVIRNISKKELTLKNECNLNFDEMDDEMPCVDATHKTAQVKGIVLQESSSIIEISGEVQQTSRQGMERDSKKLSIGPQGKINKFNGLKQSSILEIVVEQEQQQNQLNILRRYNQDEEFSPHYMEFMYSLVICHNVRSLYSRREDCLSYEYPTEMDKMQLHLANNFGFKFICRSKGEEQKIKYIIEDDFGVKCLEIAAIHQFNSRRLSVIVKLTEEMLDKFCISADDCDYVQYLRDDSLEMLGCLSLDKEQTQKLEMMISGMQKEGSRPILIYRSIMKKSQMNSFVIEANKIVNVLTTKIENTSEYQFLMHEFQRSCDLVSIFGVNEKIRKGVIGTLNSIKNLGIPCWIVSGDTYEKVLPIGYKVGLLQSQEQLITINAKTIDELYVIIKAQLQYLHSQLRTSTSDQNQKQNRQQNNRFFKRGSFASSPNIIFSRQSYVHVKSIQIAISGDSLSFIIEDSYLRKHFQFILQFTSHLVCFKAAPKQKTILIKLLKGSNLIYKNILAIGDSFSDINMFQYSDYSIQIESRRHLNSYEKYFHDKFERQRISINQLDQGQQQITFPSANNYEYLNVEPIVNMDLYLKDFNQISQLLIIENRKNAQFIDRLLIFAQFRSFGLIYLLFIYSILNAEQDILFIPQTLLQFHPNIFFLLNSVFIFKQINNVVQAEDQFINQDFFQFIFKLSHDEYRRSTILKYISRITIFPIIQSIFICYFIQYLDTITMTLDGSNINKDQVGSGLFIVILFAELTKLVQRKYVTIIQSLIIIIFSYIFYLLICLQYDQDWKEIVISWYKCVYIIFAFIFIILFHIIFNLILESFFKPFFSNLEINSKNAFDKIIDISHRVKIVYKRKTKKHKSTFEKISFFARKLFKNDEEMDQILKQMITGALGDESIESSYNKYLLKYKSNILEKKFINDIKPLLVRSFRLINIVTVFTYELSSLLILGSQVDYEILDWIEIFLIVTICLQMFLSFCTCLKSYHRYIFIIHYSSVLIRFITLILWYFNSQRFQFQQNLLIIQIGLIVIICQYQKIALTGIMLGFIIVIIYICQNYAVETYVLINQYQIVIITFCLIALIYQRIVGVFMEVFQSQITMMKESNVMKDVLGILLPKFIRNRINKEGQYDISEDQGQVGVLFCDISDFDTLIKNEQQNIVNILEHLFRGFDQLCTQHGVQKIETVGKTYMAAAGLKAVENSQQKINSINKLISLALDMRKQTITDQFQLKIGIHYGPVIAGVIGYHKPQFSLIGDTINKTSRICSTAEDGAIVISEQAYRQTNKTDVTFKLRRVDAKGLGELKTYVISNRRTTRTRQMTIRLPKVQQQLRQMQHLQEHDPIEGDNFESSRHLDNVHLLNQNQRQEILNHVRRPTVIKMDTSPSKQFSKQPSQSIIELKLQSSNKIEDQKALIRKPSDLLMVLEKATRCDLNLSEFEHQFDQYVEKERTKQVFAADEEFQIQKGLLLTLNPKKLYFQFNEDSESTKEFYKLAINHHKHFTFYFSYLICISLIITSLSLLNDLDYKRNLPNVIVGLGVSINQFIFIVLMKQNNEKYYHSRYFIILTILLYISLSVDYFRLNQWGEIQIAKGIIYNFSINFNRVIWHETKLFFNLIYIIITIVAIANQGWSGTFLYYSIILSIFGYLLQLFMFFKNVSAYNVTKQLQEKQIKQSNLLLHMLPKHILEQFFSATSEMVLVEQFEQVTLLFADIAGFTAYSNKVQADQVVNMLRNLFTEFDKLCLGQNVYKLYTIGDCYVVMGLNNEVLKSNRNPSQEAVNVVTMGFQMIEVIRRVRAIVNFPGLDMRIGVHTGNIIGGVLGTELVRYDIYGPDVLIANKMESKGTKGFVQVSQETKDLIENDFPDYFRFEMTQPYEFESINRKTNGYFVYV